MKVYVCNAFSLSMLPRDPAVDTSRKPYPIHFPIKHWVNGYKEKGAEFVSAVGHADTARVFSAELNMDIQPNRIAVRLSPSIQDRIDCVLVGQVVRQDGSPYRLPEGATELPNDATIEWWVV